MRLFHHNCVVIVALTMSNPSVLAGLYSSDERCPILVTTAGVGQELTFGSQRDGLFPQLLAEYLNALDASPSRQNNLDRKKYTDRVAIIRSKPLNMTDRQTIADLGAAYLRLGQTDDAIAILAPRGRDRQPDFRILANLAHVHAARGEWRDALDWHLNCFDLTEIPDDLPGTTAEQRQWLKKMELQFYRRWLMVHNERRQSNALPADFDIFPLFDAKFVNDEGVYQAGVLSAVERSKLPPDAVAIVQQLVLWAPWDTDLYWLLGELYAAEGRLREAEIIFNQCADGRQFANRKVFMAHRGAIRDAVAALPPETNPTDAPLFSTQPSEESVQQAGESSLPSLPAVLIAAAVFLSLACLLMILQIRAMRRRQKLPTKRQ
jgi:tetratricopeptide (TPR) repeat protein